jgi:hypothetical protein
MEDSKTGDLKGGNYIIIDTQRRYIEEQFKQPSETGPFDSDEM